MGNLTRFTPRKSVKKRNNKKYFFDYSLLFIVLFLLGFGLIMIYSASSYIAFDEYNDAAYYLKKQAIACVMGLGAMTVTALLPYHKLEKFKFIGYVVALVLIGLVKTPLGVTSHGASRWIRIPGIRFQLQPAEIAKVAIIISLSYFICYIGKNAKTLKGIVYTVGLSLPMALAIWKITNNMSSALIVVAIAAVMIFVASPDYAKFIIGGACAIAFAAVIVFVSVNFDSLGFRFERIKTWLNPESDAQNIGFQTLQGLYAIGSGGIWGKGLGQSMQKLNFLPEAQNDMIFAIICEELGIFGALAIIALFTMLIWRMMVIANNANDLYGAMLVVGVMAHIAVQTILNIAVVTNTIPNTGISLPFISYGGSSVMFLLAEIGIVLNVARNIVLKEA